MNHPLVLTDSLPLDFEGLNAACLKATAEAWQAKCIYHWADANAGTPGEKYIRGLAAVHHMKAEALCALLERGKR